MHVSYRSGGQVVSGRGKKKEKGEWEQSCGSVLVLLVDARYSSCFQAFPLVKGKRRIERCMSISRGMGVNTVARLCLRSLQSDGA